MLQIVFIERNMLTQTIEKYFCERLLSQDASGEWSMRHLLNTLFVLSEDIYLSLENENIIGAVSISIYKGKSFIEALAVDKKYRNRGYGKSLIEKAIGELEKPVYIISKVDEFYLKNGFVYSNEELIDKECKACNEYNITCFPKVVVYR